MCFFKPYHRNLAEIVKVDFDMHVADAFMGEGEGGNKTRVQFVTAPICATENGLLVYQFC